MKFYLIFNDRLPWQTKLQCNSYKTFLHVINTLSSIILSKINDVAQRVDVSEILHQFPNLPHPFKAVYDPSRPGLAILYRKVPHMLHAKYQPNQPSGSGEEVVRMVFTIYGHYGHLEI